MNQKRRGYLDLGQKSKKIISDHPGVLISVLEKAVQDAIVLTLGGAQAMLIFLV